MYRYIRICNGAAVSVTYLANKTIWPLSLMLEKCLDRCMEVSLCYFAWDRLDLPSMESVVVQCNASNVTFFQSANVLAPDALYYEYSV